MTASTWSSGPGPEAGPSVLVLYRSVYGSTQRYAEWIGEGTGALVAETASFDPARLPDFDIVFIGSPAYFGRLRCRRFVKRNWPVLKEKRTIVFGVTGIPPDDARQGKMLERSFPPEIRDSITYRPMRGAFSYRNLKLRDKILMSGPRIRLQARWLIMRDKRAGEMLKRFFEPKDWTDRSAVDVLCFSLGIPEGQHDDVISRRPEEKRHGI